MPLDLLLPISISHPTHHQLLMTPGVKVTTLLEVSEAAGKLTSAPLPTLFNSQALKRKLDLDEDGIDPRNFLCLVEFQGVSKFVCFIGSPGSCIFGPSALKFGKSKWWALQMDAVCKMVSRVPRPSSTSHNPYSTTNRNPSDPHLNPPPSRPYARQERNPGEPDAQARRRRRRL